MVINLKQISFDDDDNIKLDKINYNFDQLIANGGGPQGPSGAVGDQGATGITGAQGFQGPIGLTGSQGDAAPESISYWKNTAGEDTGFAVDTIIPIHNPTVSTYPPVVSVGFISTEPEYNNGQNTENGQLPYQWIVNRRNNFKDNLRFTSQDVANNSFNFKMERDSSIDKFTMGFNNVQGTSLVWYAQNHIFIDNTTSEVLLDISDSKILYNRDVEFDRPVTINGQLIIGNANAGTDKVAVAEDATGKVIFKNAEDIGGLIPQGSIVPILPAFFNDGGRFINEQTETLESLNDLLKVRIGTGIGDYDGWYLCNGKTWKDGEGLEFEVPDLNSFSYTIADNMEPDGQGSASVTNNETHIIGGARVFNNAEYSSGTYTISSIVDTTNVSIQNVLGGGTTFKIKRLPQIIYLGKSDLYWEDAGSKLATEL